METKRKIKFIINPTSGGIHVLPIKSTLEYFIDDDSIEYDFATTTHKGHAYELTKEIAQKGDTDIVVAVGGDGTVNEVGRGLIGTDTALGIIPFGSGNGLARHLGIPMDPINCIKWINKCRIAEIDYGIINEHPFFCTCGLGFDADVSKRFADSKIRGAITYIEKILQEALTHKDESLIIKSDIEQIDTEAFIVTCANAGQWGNNAYIAPLASVTDGLLDITIVTPFTPLDIPTLAYQLFNKHLDKNKKIRTLKTTQLTINRKKNGVVHIDGDPVMLDKEIKIKIVTNGLKVAIPLKKRKI
ncbi:MAG: YegS/Rv2252/BmrU family lipid kinase [Bacteroidaceae bacterium]|nr:YegS/Rv2252/BmrU family lipid kinase [Bacteroidaceae bacterium]